MEMEYYGFAGKILHINLTTGEVRKEPLDLEIARKYIGGFGVCCKLAYDMITPRIDPFSEENPIIISVGVLVGTCAPSASKIVAMTKSPFPASERNINFINFGSAGSSKFGIMMKNAGYDHLVIEGKSRKPVFIKIEDDTVEVCEATHLWGRKDAYETADELSKDLKGCGVISIGAGGENLVTSAMAVTDKGSHLGKNGVGTIFGSKKLKAIAIKGKKGIRVSDPKVFMKTADEIGGAIRKNPTIDSVHELGLHAAWSSNRHCTGSGNWNEDQWDKWYGIRKCKEVKKTTRACTSCYLGCKGEYEVMNGEYAGLKTDTVHYATIALIAEMLEIEDHRKALKLADFCNRAGICIFRASSMIDWVTSLSEEGRIGEEVTDGQILTRSFDNYLGLLEKIVKREGLGDALADGWLAVSKRLGVEAKKDHIKGRGIIKGSDAILDARTFGFNTMTFGYIVNPRTHHGYIHSAQYGGILNLMEVEVLKKDIKEMGANEEEIERIFTPTAHCGVPNVARATKYAEDCGTVHQSLGTCDIPRVYGYFPLEKLAELYSSATGIEKTTSDLKEDGERISNLFKMLNVREGFSRMEDEPPPVWFKPLQTPEGERAMKDYYQMKRLTRDDLHRLLDDYYDERGWSIEAGVPTRETLRRLDLEECIKDITSGEQGG